MPLFPRVPLFSMARAKAIRLRSSARPGWRIALAYLAILAVAFQSYIVQTHIHLTPGDAARLAGTAVTHGQDSHDKYPASDDPANCPICQEILHSGQFVTPAAQMLLPPALAVSTIAVVDTPLAIALAPSHSWRGRAPPSL
jgi:hypothetical protein